MEILRKLTALILAVALANYGALATASVHSHDYAGFHGVHVLADGDHDHDHDVHQHQAAEKKESTPASDHSEPGYHSHSSPQFGPADGQAPYVAFAVREPSLWHDPSGMISPRKDQRPFKPPRFFL